jgi:ABC-type transport system involved in cytochrome c biogenesis permease subunit
MMALMVLVLLAAAGYGIAAVLLTGYLFFSFSGKSARMGFGAFYFSFVAVSSTLLFSIARGASIPFLLMFLVMLNGLFLAVMKKWKIQGASPLLSALCIAVLLLQLFRLSTPSSFHLSGGSAWFYIHLTAFLFTCACFTLAAFCAALYLLQARLLKKKRLKGAFMHISSLRELDDASYRLIVLGFPVLLAGVFSGSIWSHVYQGTYWSFRPGGLSAMIMALIYFACFHARMISRWQGVKISLMLVISFLLMLFSLLMIGHLPL